MRLVEALGGLMQGGRIGCMCVCGKIGIWRQTFLAPEFSGH